VPAAAPAAQMPIAPALLPGSDAPSHYPSEAPSEHAVTPGSDATSESHSTGPSESPSPHLEVKVQWPVSINRISRGFQLEPKHRAVDIPVPEGSEVRASHDG